MRQLRMLLDWFPNTIHAGMLLAQKRGYYAKEGIELVIEGKVHGVLEAQGADFVCGPEASMLTEMAEDGTLIGVAALSHKQDSGIISLAEAGIERPRDLTGKRLTHWKPAWFHKVVGELVNRDGGDYSKVQLVQMDVGKPEEVLGKTADAIWIYKYWEFFVMKHLGYKVNYIPFRDKGHPFDFPAPAMSAKRELVEKEPETVKAFLRATAKGYEDVAKEASAVLPEIKDQLPDAPEAMLKDSLDYVAPLLLDDEGKWGRLDTEAWMALQNFLSEKGILGDKKMPVTYTNALWS